VGQTMVLTLPRVYPKTPDGRARRIDYRHLIHALSAKPQAFRYSQFRDDLLPTPQYKELWLRAQDQFDARNACKWIVSVLRFAYDYDCESQLASELLQKEALPDLKALQKRFLPNKKQPDIPPRQHTIGSYDSLLKGSWIAGGQIHV